jgi:type VI secretion system protein VasG
MAEISRAVLFGKLNPLGYKAIESATVFCKLRGNPYVELVHWFHQILQLQDSDLHRLLKHFAVDPARLAQDMTQALDRLPRGATSISDLSSHVEETVERAWVFATLLFGEGQVRSGHLIYGILKTPGLRNTLFGMSKEFSKISEEQLGGQMGKIVGGSPEDRMVAYDGSQLGAAAPGEASGAMAPAQMGKQEALQRFSTDLTDKARKGEIDPIVGRDDEIRQIMDILMRRRQNNPIITGEAGVGKTAVVEGFALRIAKGDVPPPMKDVALRALDVGLLQAGASMKGEFEQRLRQVIEEVQASPKPIILFIDEAHTLIGAGGAAGTGDAANLLKPALARGTLRTIGATTWTEYKKYIEKDPALTRRFQPVQVDEPSEEKAILMMRGVASTLEKHHKIQLLDEAIEAAVKLSHRYIPARQLPDKSVSLLDTACARVAISQHAVPPEVEDCRRRIEALETELEILGRERAIGEDTAKREADAEAKLADERVRLTGLEERWAREKALVDQVLDLRAKLRGHIGPVEGTGSALEKAAQTVAPATSVIAAPAGSNGGTPALSEAERAEALGRLKQVQAELTEIQGEHPLILVSVDEQAVAKVVEDWTGIPVGRMVKNEIEAILKLKDTLIQRVVGQDHAMQMISRRVQTSRAGLENPSKPIGVFMLCGPSGVGKTETALALAESLYGGEQNVITINMSEFQEAHTVSTLKGSPPGYVGYGEGGILTEAVRRKPYSVVLLDEVEKAHPDVHEIFFQIFDKGIMDDSEGRRIDFKNTLILLTSNVGSDLIMNMCKDPELLPEPEGLAQALRDPLLKVFPAALLGRLIVIPYYPLNDRMIDLICRLNLRRIEKRIRESHDVPFTYDEEVVKLVASRCTELESGGRMIDAILTNTVLPTLSGEFLTRMMEGRPVTRVHIGVADSEFAYAFD